MDASVITVWGSPGAGKTTLAVNLACALAQTRCVGLISSNLQCGHLQVFFGQTINLTKGLLNALEDPANTTNCFWKAGKGYDWMENLFLLTVPNEYSGLLCDNVTQEAVEQVLERARTTFEVLIVDGSGDLMNPVSDVGITQSSQVLMLHHPSAASGLWYRSVHDFVRQLHLKDKLIHVMRENPWGLPAREYAAALEIETELYFPNVTHARQLEDSGAPIYWDSDKACRRYKKETGRLLQILQQREAVS